MLLWFLAKNVGIVFGYMYPAYQTFKALDGKDKEARLQLLRYWAVFATFSAAEFYTDMFVSWLPFYYEVKMLLLLYLSIPFTKGSSTVYEMHMKPWLRAHQVEIDEAINQFRSSILEYVVAYRDRVVLWAHQSVINFCSSKLPAALPLYMMVSALISETCKHLFGSPSPDSSAIAESEQVETSAPVSPVEAMVILLPTTETKSEPVPIRSSQPSVKAPAPADLVASNIASSTPVMATPHPALAQYGNTTRSRTTSHVIPHASASRSHKRDTSAPVAVAEPRTRAAKKQVMQGTAMPPRIPAKPVPQLIKKEAVAVVEEDSIHMSSPSKRSSNPKIIPGSPHRRSAV
jgi:hypothetical protein